MGWRNDQRFYEQNYYGEYCNKVREQGLEPIPYHRFVDELGLLLGKDLTKKERMAELINLTRGEVVKILECSSKGDKRFSAFYARVTAFGVFDSIENHYQLSKRFGDFAPSSWRDAKGKNPTHIELNGKQYDLKMLSQWYKLLWVRYLDNNPNLVEYASQYDDFSDMFKGKSINCQADVIRQYVKQGRNSVLNDCVELINEIGK